jgi:hypothetical protein
MARWVGRELSRWQNAILTEKCESELMEYLTGDKEEQVFHSDIGRLKKWFQVALPGDSVTQTDHVREAELDLVTNTFDYPGP